MQNRNMLVIYANTEEELAEKVNNHQVVFTATQPKQKQDGTWVAFCYYDPTRYSSLQTKPVRRYPLKKILATENQVDFILKKNIDVNTENLTKQEATRLIAEFLEKQKKKK